MTNKTSKTSITDDAARSEYVRGLRALADLLERHPELPLPLKETFAVFARDKEVAADWVRVLPGEKKKVVNSDETHMIFGRTSGVFGPHGFNVWIERDKVCRRVVTGQRITTKTVPVATEDVTVTEDVVEWVCEPLLAEAIR